MALLAKHLSSAFSCRNCQRELINTFTSIAGISLRPPRPQSVKRPVGLSLQTRTLRTRAYIRPARGEQTRGEEEAATISEGTLHEEVVQDAAQVEKPAVPWYLQDDTPTQVPNPLAERQRIPELPPDPPQLLQPILEHISVDLGLDYVSLLDLRKLDPPPALGANLLMIIGTTRSEKHLHVSADRFCRWLRSTYKLTPFADGLLGRNELKLKLRRKARRARLMKNVGSPEDGVVDDGIRTGWVCVNVGDIERGKAVQRDIIEPEGFVGFGSQIGGVTLVVQMLTEEKREELDLEQLWGDTVTRQQEKQAWEAQKEINLLKHEVKGVGGVFTGPRYISTDPSLPTSNRKQQFSASPASRRSFHTDISRRGMSVSIQDHLEYEGLDSTDLEPRIQAQEAVSSDTQSNTRQELTGFAQSGELIALDTLLKYLRNLPRKDAIQVLGKGENDFDSTSFLTAFYQYFPLFPNMSYMLHRLDLVCTALEAKHPGYTKKHLAQLLRQIQASTAQVPIKTLFNVFNMLLIPDGPQDKLKHHDRVEPLEYHGYFLHEENLELAVQVLEDIILALQDIPHPGCVVSLYKGLARVQCAPDPKDPASLRPDALFRLMLVLDRRGITVTESEDHADILLVLADANRWDAYWRYWRSLARRSYQRPHSLYRAMFLHVAASRHQSRCIEALTDWIPEMSREEPPVMLRGPVAAAVMECLRVAEPNVEVYVRDPAKMNGEWVRLWKRCVVAAGEHAKSALT
ncbi:ATPase synthesis protein 25 mitochondrial [Loxospora ochrophaea]|nr:ATPase synthesis protein 25 mitochondrial [Loxospora ochrophaea]